MALKLAQGWYVPINRKNRICVLVLSIGIGVLSGCTGAEVKKDSDLDTQDLVVAREEVTYTDEAKISTGRNAAGAVVSAHAQSLQLDPQVVLSDRDLAGKGDLMTAIVLDELRFNLNRRYLDEVGHLPKSASYGMGLASIAGKGEMIEAQKQNAMGTFEAIDWSGSLSRWYDGLGSESVEARNEFRFDTLTTADKRLQELVACGRYIKGIREAGGQKGLYHVVSLLRFTYDDGSTTRVGYLPETRFAALVESNSGGQGDGGQDAQDKVYCKKLTIQPDELITNFSVATDRDRLSVLNIRLAKYSFAAERDQDTNGFKVRVNADYIRDFVLGDQTGIYKFVHPNLHKFAGVYGTLATNSADTGLMHYVDSKLQPIIDDQPGIASLGLILGRGGRDFEDQRSQIEDAATRAQSLRSELVAAEIGALQGWIDAKLAAPDRLPPVLTIAQLQGAKARLDTWISKTSLSIFDPAAMRASQLNLLSQTIGSEATRLFDLIVMAEIEARYAGGLADFWRWMVNKKDEGDTLFGYVLSPKSKLRNPIAQPFYSISELNEWLNVSFSLKLKPVTIRDLLIVYLDQVQTVDPNLESLVRPEVRTPKSGSDTSYETAETMSERGITLEFAAGMLGNRCMTYNEFKSEAYYSASQLLWSYQIKPTCADSAVGGVCPALNKLRAGLQVKVALGIQRLAQLSQSEVGYDISRNRVIYDLLVMAYSYQSYFMRRSEYGFNPWQSHLDSKVIESGLKDYSDQCRTKIPGSNEYAFNYIASFITNLYSDRGFVNIYERLKSYSAEGGD